jgi:hypothetical protein
MKFTSLSVSFSTRVLFALICLPFWNKQKENNGLHEKIRAAMIFEIVWKEQRSNSIWGMITIIKCLIRLIRIVSSNRNEILYMNFTSLSASFSTRVLFALISACFCLTFWNKQKENNE